MITGKIEQIIQMQDRMRARLIGLYRDIREENWHVKRELLGTETSPAPLTGHPYLVDYLCFDFENVQWFDKDLQILLIRLNKKHYETFQQKPLAVVRAKEAAAEVLAITKLRLLFCCYPDLQSYTRNYPRNLAYEELCSRNPLS